MISATLCCAATAFSEVKQIDENTVTMHIDEYRFFITQIKTLEVEAAGLKRALAEERASLDILAAAADDADTARLEERRAADARIKKLETDLKDCKRRQWLPGVIGGGGITGSGKAEGVIGLGWKIDIF